MTALITRTEGPTRRRAPATRRHPARWLVLLTTLLLGITNLTAAPASGQDPQDEWRAKHEAYGLHGCTTVDGFNDRCPASVSWPHRAPNGGTPTPSRLIASPDGTTLYYVGDQSGEDENGVIYVETFIAAYHATGFDEGREIWSASFGRTLDEYRLNFPDGAALSNDGSRLYVTGPTVIDGFVAAFDTATGANLWKVTVSELIGPIVGEAFKTARHVVVGADDRSIFVAAGVAYADSVDPDGLNQEAWFLALNAATGTLEWKTNYTANKPNWVNSAIANTLAVSSDGSRLFAQSDLHYPSRGNRGNATLAFDTATGEIVWHQAYFYPRDDGVQAPPKGLQLSPDDTRVFVLATHWFNNASGEQVGNFVVLAYDAVNGTLLWSGEYDGTAGTGCDENLVASDTLGRALDISPSGDLLYLVGSAVYPLTEGGNCFGAQHTTTERGTAVMAVQATTGQQKWATFFGRDGGNSCSAFFCDIAVAPGPEGGDAASQVVVTTGYLPSWARQIYPLTFALDGTTGGLLWQGRYLDTYNSDNPPRYHALGASTVSPDGTRFYRAASRDVPAQVNVLGYDLRRPDLTPTTLTVSQEKPRNPAVLTVTVTNTGEADASNVTVMFYDGDTVIDETVPVEIAKGTDVDVSVTWDLRGVKGERQITAVVDPDSTVAESNEDNNTITVTISGGKVR